MCYDNTCRSPVAEYVLKNLVKEAGLDHKSRIASSATSREKIGNPVYPPGISWRSMASLATNIPPGSYAIETTRNTTCSLEWTRRTSATYTAFVAAISTTRCTYRWNKSATWSRRWPAPGAPTTPMPPGGLSRAFR